MFSLLGARGPDRNPGRSRYHAACCDGSAGDGGYIATTPEYRVVQTGLDSAYEIPSRANASTPQRPTGRVAEDGELLCFTDQPLPPCPLPRAVTGSRLARLRPQRHDLLARPGASQQEMEQNATAKSRACNGTLSLIASEREARLPLLGSLPPRRDGTST